MPSPARPDELDHVIALIAAEQRRLERNIVYLGEEPDGIRAELDALEPDWRTTVRVVHGPTGALIGAALAEWDTDPLRAWLQGPWVTGDDDQWARFARPLIDAVAAQVPAEIVDRELAGTVANVRLAALAAELGWPASETNYAYVLDGDAAAAVAAGSEPLGLRPAVDSDLPAIDVLHEGEFPATYYSAAQLLQRAAAGEHIVLVAEGADGSVAGNIAGYVAGRVQPDGEGYIDFLAVDPAARGAGIGRRLVNGLARQLLPASTTGRVSLTVQEHREPARALYAALGFRLDAAFRGYRTGRPS